MHPIRVENLGNEMVLRRIHLFEEDKGVRDQIELNGGAFLDNLF